METISVLISQEDGLWLAQCVEQDLATQAPTLEELEYDIQLMLIAHVASCEEHGIEPFKIPPAPADVREQYERGVPYRTILSITFEAQAELKHRVPRVECRLAP